MIFPLIAVLIAAITPATGRESDRGRTRRQNVARRGSALALPNVGSLLEQVGRDIEVLVVPDAEGGVSGGSNVVDLGRVSYRPTARSAGRLAGRGSSLVTVLRRVVTVRIGTERGGFAPLRVSLQSDDGRCRIRVDGKTLTAVPQMIDPLAPLGLPVGHVVEVEIPTTAPEGPVAASILWSSDRP